jgi:hypothetical protein
MPEDFDDRLDDLETLTRHVAAVVFKMDAALDELKGFNREQVAINHRLETTLGRLETRMERIVELLERSLGGSTNGRDGA